MAKTRTNRDEVMKETATSVAGADLDNASVACFDCKVEFRHKEMFSESTCSLDIGAKDPNDNVSVCKQCFEAILEQRGGATMIPPDIGDLGHSATRDRRRNYKYREYSFNPVMDDGSSMYTTCREDTLANALAKAEMYAAECDYVVVIIEDGMLWWVPEHSDSHGNRVEGNWEWDTIDEIEGYRVRKGNSGITTERLAPKNWASAY